MTQAEENDIERVQKVACRLILQEEYISYENALDVLDLDNLKDRRQKLCLKFAKRCLKFDKSKSMFPRNEPDMHNIRSYQPFKVNYASKDRLLTSAIPQMQRLLNAC